MLTVNGVGPTAINFNGTSLTQVWACNHNTGECNLVWPSEVKMTISGSSTIHFDDCYNHNSLGQYYCYIGPRDTSDWTLTTTGTFEPAQNICYHITEAPTFAVNPMACIKHIGMCPIPTNYNTVYTCSNYCMTHFCLAIATSYYDSEEGWERDTCYEMPLSCIGKVCALLNCCFTTDRGRTYPIAQQFPANWSGGVFGNNLPDDWRSETLSSAGVIAYKSCYYRDCCTLDWMQYAAGYCDCRMECFLNSYFGLSIPSSVEAIDSLDLIYDEIFCNGSTFRVSYMINFNPYVASGRVGFQLCSENYCTETKYPGDDLNNWTFKRK